MSSSHGGRSPRRQVGVQAQRLDDEHRAEVVLAARPAEAGGRVGPALPRPSLRGPADVRLHARESAAHALVAAAPEPHERTGDGEGVALQRRPAWLSHAARHEEGGEAAVAVSVLQHLAGQPIQARVVTRRHAGVEEQADQVGRERRGVVAADDLGRLPVRQAPQQVGGLRRRQHGRVRGLHLRRFRRSAEHLGQRDPARGRLVALEQPRHGVAREDVAPLHREPQPSVSSACTRIM